MTREMRAVPRIGVVLLAAWLTATPVSPIDRPGESDAGKLIASLKSRLEGVPLVGSGLVVAATREALYVAVPNHLVRADAEDAEAITVEFKAFPQLEIDAELTPFEDRSLDLAVVTVRRDEFLGFTPDAFPFARLGDPSALKKGDELFHIGESGGKRWQSNARADSFSRLDAPIIHFESDSIWPGRSGAGLFDRHWRVVGLVLRIDGQGNGNALTVDAILDRLRESQIPISYPGLPQQVPSDLAPEVARLRIESALRAADLSDRRISEAVETLLYHGFDFANRDLGMLALRRAHLEDSSFAAANFLASEFHHSSFDRSILDQAVFNFATLEHTSFRNAHARRAYFEFTKADRAIFTETQLDGSSFFMSSLRGADFSGANLRGAALAYCDLRGADFSGANLEGTIFTSSILDGADFENATIRNTDFGSAVAATLDFTEEQRAELRRSSTLDTWMDVRLWGHTRSSDAWNIDFPDVGPGSVVGFRDLPEHDQKSLTFRDPESPQPVGALTYFKPEGRNRIRAFYWFKEAFWESGDHSDRMRQRVAQQLSMLVDQLGSLPPVEGTGAQFDSWLESIERVAKSDHQAAERRLQWSSDALLVLLLERGILEPDDLDAFDWEDLAEGRCERDAQHDDGIFADSWRPLYPAGVVCDALPPSHVDHYRRWTLGRSRLLYAERLEVMYWTQAFDFRQLQSITTQSGPMQRLFAHQEQRQSYLDASMSPSRARNIIGSPRARAGGRDAFLSLPHDASRYAVSISEEALDAFSEFVQLHVVYSLGKVTKDNSRGVVPEDVILEVVPERAWITSNGDYRERMWEGEIHVLPTTP